jgi:tRNA pseudouridine55 synthase
VRCSSGTYVRTIARDLGERLGTGAHLTALRRTTSGDWTLAHAITLADCERDVEAMRARVVPMSGLLTSWPAVTVNVDGERRVRHGQMLRPADLADLLSPEAATGAEIEGTEGIRVLTGAGDLIAIAKRHSGGLLHPGLVLV